MKTCRYCRADALEPMDFKTGLYKCLVCLRVERAEETLARVHREAGGLTIGNIRVFVDPNQKSWETRIFVLPRDFESLPLHLVPE